MDGRSTMRRRFMTGMSVMAGMVIAVMTSSVFGFLVGGQRDAFLEDNSPRAVGFRAAWKAATELEGHLEPLPEGVTGEQQRKLAIEAFEKAISMMPEAPPCPGMLLRIGQLWNSSGLGNVQPAMALEAYTRLRSEYPTHDREVIQAIGGQSFSLWLLKRPREAAGVLEELFRYRLPADAPPDTVRLLSTLQTQMKPHMASYLAEAVGLEADSGQILLPGGRRLPRSLNAAALTALEGTVPTASTGRTASRPSVWPWVSLGVLVVAGLAVFTICRTTYKGRRTL
jgi:hypothetical protein